MAEDSSLPQPTYTRFAVIGSGFSGIGFGATLQRWYGIDDVRIFEREADLGGTWYMNRYPGCACDVPSALYSFSFECNPDWSRVLNSQQEIWAYLRRVAVKYDLVQRTSFSTLVESAAWHEASSRWRLILRDLRTDIRLVHETQFLFSGAGILVEPRPLDVPGVARFAGPLLHTARWPREGVDLAGRDVVLFGNGCTAVQVVSAVAPHVGRLTQFVRNKHWILPSIDDTTRRTLQFALKYVPGAAWLQRILVFLVAENALRGFYRTRLGEAFRRGKEETARRLVRKNAPPEYHDMLLPDFPIGCKRRIFDTGYLAALGRENITLTDEKVLEVVPEGVRTEKGIVKADIIISANGFVVNNFLGKMEIRGRGGRTIQEHWEEYGGPEAYNCSLLHDFPNFFMLLGPNSATGHTSCIMAIENSVNYALRIIKPVLDGHGTIVELKKSAEKSYVQRVQNALTRTVFGENCQSWYQRGSDGKTWNGMTYPWSQFHYWYRSFFPSWSDLQYRGQVKTQRRSRHTLKLVFLVAALLSVVFIPGKQRISKSAVAARDILRTRGRSLS